ncbi:MAG: hypothetical protein HY329_25410, partial [Chloroflexi bacterium]|nr:hypothetical protein [Chloroflexota bacterium]
TGEKKYTTQKLAVALDVPQSSIKTAPQTDPNVDVRVILGADARFPSN